MGLMELQNRWDDFYDIGYNQALGLWTARDKSQPASELITAPGEYQLSDKLSAHFGQRALALGESASL